MDIRMDYRGWKFRDKVPLIPRDQQWKHYFDSKFDAIDVDVTVDIDTDEIINAIGFFLHNLVIYRSLRNYLLLAYKKIQCNFYNILKI